MTDIRYRPARTIDARPMDRVRLAGQSGEHKVGEKAVRSDSARLAELRSFIKLQEENRAFVLLAINPKKEIVGWALSLLIISSGKKDTDRSDDGWYLMGVMVHPKYRRQGIGEQLTRRRIKWLESRARKVRYFTQADNKVSRGLHDKFGFKALRLVDSIAGLRFGENEKLVFELKLSKRKSTPPSNTATATASLRPKSKQHSSKP